MIGMQYNITLPTDYNMEIIKERVKANGHKTDGFEDLTFKFYLTTEKGVNGNFQNSYCPLYFWKDNKGMNKFIFNGFYDNILGSFGWQKINIGIPFLHSMTGNIGKATYAAEVVRNIDQQTSLTGIEEMIRNEISSVKTDYAVIYNPDKWKYHIFTFARDIGALGLSSGRIYDILHVSGEQKEF